MIPPEYWINVGKGIYLAGFGVCLFFTGLALNAIINAMKERTYNISIDTANMTPEEVKDALKSVMEK